MNALRIVAFALIIGGVLALAYGGFNYTSESHTAALGPLRLQINETRHVNIPLWAGIAAIVGGVLLLVYSRKT